jgi:hypothetical protein
MEKCVQYLSATNFVYSGAGMTNLDYHHISANKSDLSVHPLKRMLMEV